MTGNGNDHDNGLFNDKIVVLIDGTGKKDNVGNSYDGEHNNDCEERKINNDVEAIDKNGID